MAITEQHLSTMVLVIGTGGAGLRASIELAEAGVDVLAAGNRPKERYGMDFAREADSRISQGFFGAHKYRRSAFAGDYTLAAGGHTRIWRRTSSRRDDNTGDSFRLAVEAGEDVGVHPDIAGYHDRAHAFDLRSAALAARATLVSAPERRETRGCHNRSGYPETDTALRVNLVWSPIAGVTRESIPPIPDEIASLMGEISTAGKLVE